MLLSLDAVDVEVQEAKTRDGRDRRDTAGGDGGGEGKEEVPGARKWGEVRRRSGGDVATMVSQFRVG